MGARIEEAANRAEQAGGRITAGDYFLRARIPFGKFMANKEPASFRVAHPELQWLWDSPDTLLPVLETPDCFEIIVAGASGGRSAWSYGAAEPVSRLIEQ